MDKEVTMLIALLGKMLVELSRKNGLDHPVVETADELARHLYERLSNQTTMVPKFAQKPPAVKGEYNPKFDHEAGVVGSQRGVKRTSVPSLEELNKPDFEPGQDPLPME